MNVWMTEFKELAGMLIADPGSVQMWIILGVALIGAYAVMFLTGNAFGIPATNGSRVLPVFLLAALLVPGAVVASRLYLLPKIDNSTVQVVVTVAMSVVVLLVVVAPVQMLLQKSKYFQGLFNVLLSMVTAVLLVLLTRGLFDAASSGAKSMGPARRNKEKLEELTN